MQKLVGSFTPLRHGLDGRTPPRGHHRHIQDRRTTLGEHLGDNVNATGKPVQRPHGVAPSQSSATSSPSTRSSPSRE
eukprot:2234763-Pyramimonas_sp.AAC.1